MEDVERQNAHYGQGRLHFSHNPQKILKCLHQRTMIIYIPLDDPGVTQGAQRAKKPQIP